MKKLGIQELLKVLQVAGGHRYKLFRFGTRIGKNYIYIRSNYS